MRLKSTLLFASAVLLLNNSFAQTHVKTNGKKYTLIEEATGTWCGWCPDGAQVLEQSVEPNFPRANIVSWHNADGLELSGDPFCTGSGYITGFPLGTVNRFSWPSGGIQQDRGKWVNDCITDSSTTPKFDVSMTCTYDTGTRLLKIAVTGKALSALTGQWNINAYIVEDSISSSVEAQHSYLNPTGTMCANGQPSWFVGKGNPITPSSWYAHMNVVMNVMATGGSIWGDSICKNPAANTSYTKNYTYTIPTTSNYKMVKVVGMVQKYGATTSDRAIENSIKAWVKTMWKNTTNVSAINSAISEVELYPNPAGNYVTVGCQLGAPSAMDITISNSLGQKVSENHYAAGSNNFSEQVSLSNLSNGIYFMTLNSNGEKVTKRFVVSK